MSSSLGFTDAQLARITLGMLEPGRGWAEFTQYTKYRPGPEPNDERALMARVYDSGFMPSTIKRDTLLNPPQVLEELRAIANS